MFFETVASRTAHNTPAAFFVYTTLVTSLLSPTITSAAPALPSSTTAAISVQQALAKGHIGIPPWTDDPSNKWQPDEHRADELRFYKELILTFGIFGMAIGVIWLWSLFTCWLRGDCFWHCDKGTCWGARRKWGKMKTNKHGYREESCRRDNEGWRYE